MPRHSPTCSIEPTPESISGAKHPVSGVIHCDPKCRSMSRTTQYASVAVAVLPNLKLAQAVHCNENTAESEALTHAVARRKYLGQVADLSALVAKGDIMAAKELGDLANRSYGCPADIEAGLAFDNAIQTGQISRQQALVEYVIDILGDEDWMHGARYGNKVGSIAMAKSALASLFPDSDMRRFVNGGFQWDRVARDWCRWHDDLDDDTALDIVLEEMALKAEVDPRIATMSATLTAEVLEEEFRRYAASIISGSDVALLVDTRNLHGFEYLLSHFGSIKVHDHVAIPIPNSVAELYKIRKGPMPLIFEDLAN